MTELVTEMPRSFSSAIQSLVAWRAALRDFTLPAIWIAPPNSSSFSVSVVLPASGCETIAKVRRRRVSSRWEGIGKRAPGGRDGRRLREGADYTVRCSCYADRRSQLESHRRDGPLPAA